MPAKRPHALILSAVALALCSVSHFAWSQTTPNAGQVLRDLQQAPAVVPPAPPLQRIDEVQDPTNTNEAKVTVKAIRISGNNEVATSRLAPLFASLVGTEQTLSQLNAAAQRITAYYRRQGFAVARAYLPAQDITDGAITIAVLEGRISSQKLSNQSSLSDERTRAYLAGVKDGDVIKSEQIDRGLLLLQDTPGIASSRATLQPGASPGTSELLIEVKSANTVSGNVTLDNYGSRYTGEYRAGGGLNIASPLRLGDLLSFNALSSGSDLNFGRLAYQVPVGSDGLRVGAAHFDVRYKLGREFDNLQAHGTANSTTLFAAYPFIRSQLKNLSGTVSYEDKNTVDYIDSTATVTPKKLKVASLGLTGNLQDTLAGGGFNSVDLSYVAGNLSIQSPTALTLDAASAQTNGSYSKITWGISRLQRITNDTLVAFALAGQQAGKNLDSSEKFSLGGPTSIRAYPTGEGSGDEGYRSTLELRHTLMPQVQGVLFYDFGSVRINKNPFGGAANNNKTMAGAGFGVNASVADRVQLKASVAWRTSGDLPLSIPASAVRSATFWLQAAVAF